MALTSLVVAAIEALRDHVVGMTVDDTDDLGGSSAIILLARRPSAPGFSAQMKTESVAAYGFPDGPQWRSEGRL
ncbi:MAG: hypothetical protein ACR2F6_17310 [Mycobacteriales bacterium]